MNFRKKATILGRVHRIIEKAEGGDTASAVFDWLIIILIC